MLLRWVGARDGESVSAMAETICCPAYGPELRSHPARLLMLLAMPASLPAGHAQPAARRRVGTMRPRQVGELFPSRL